MTARRDRKQYFKEYRAANRERRRVSNIAYQAANADRLRAYKAGWYAANKEHHDRTVAAWREANREQRKEYCRLFHSARRRNKNKDKLTVGIIDLLLLEQNDTCPYCFRELSETGFHIDHYMPLALGGKNVDDNVQLTCPTCNMRKGKKHPMVFLNEVFRSLQGSIACP